MSTPRFNLRNASLFLNKIRQKYYQNNNNKQQHRQSQQQQIYNSQNKTFIDEQDQIISQSTHNEILKKQQDQNQQQQSLNNNNNNTNILSVESNNTQSIMNNFSNIKNINHINNINTKININKINQFTATQQYQQLQHHPPLPLLTKTPTQLQTQFCDLIIIKYLQQTLQIYKSDLQTLQHNRQNLQQQIYFLGKKIKKIPEINKENLFLQEQLNKLKQNLIIKINQYHQSNKLLFKQKLKRNQMFKNHMNKIKWFLMINGNNNNNNKNNNDERQNYFVIDSFQQGYLNTYEEYRNQRQEYLNKINDKVKKDVKNPEKNKENKRKLLKKMFNGKEQIYLTQEINKNNQLKLVKNQSTPVEPTANSNQKQIKDALLYDEQDELEKKKQSSQPKKISASQKALLLGDLKNFSKSFKLPTK